MTIRRSLQTSYWPIDESEVLVRSTLGDLLRSAAAEAPDHVALVDVGDGVEPRRAWTYRELLAACERTAHALLARFAPGERVALCAPNCAEWVLLQHGLHLAGLVLVPINPAYRKSEIEVILRSSGAVGLIHVDRYRSNDLAGIAANLRADLPDLRETIRIADWEHDLVEADPQGILPAIRPEDVLQLQYTSGTTGVPKGARLHHLGAVNTSRFVAHRAGFPEGGVWLNAMPLFHIAGAVVTQIGTIARKGTYVLMPGFEAGRFLELIESERPDVSLIVPTMILAALEHPDLATRRCDSLRTILSGAATVPAALVHRVRQAFGCEFSILFGQTETNGVFSQTRLDDLAEDQSETLGRPLPQIEVAIMNPETGDVEPIGVAGEICIRGYQSMYGYYGLEEATRQTIREDGWLRTGDVGTMDGRGYLRIAGRLKDMIIRGGMNLYPREIEDALFDHPDVGQAAVVGVPDEKWGEIVAAVVIPAPHVRDLPVAELHRWCREKLAVHKTPALWIAVEALPLTASGKVQKFVLQEQITRGELRPVHWAKQDHA